MPLTGIYLFCGGVLVSLAAFLFLLLNMYLGVTKDGSFRTIVGGHLGGMAGMAVGGVVAFFGLVMAAVQAFQFYG